MDQIHKNQVPLEEKFIHKRVPARRRKFKKNNWITIRPIFHRWETWCQRASGTPMTNSRLTTKLKKSQHGLRRRPSPTNNNRQRSIQMLMPSSGQRIARKYMKEASPSYQTRTPSSYTRNEKVLRLVLVCSPNDRRSHTSTLPCWHIWRPDRKSIFDFNDI